MKSFTDIVVNILQDKMKSHNAYRHLAQDLPTQLLASRVECVENAACSKQLFLVVFSPLVWWDRWSTPVF